MNATAIIAEYNPFHNGHAYQLNAARNQTNADYLIVVMSGNFVQRGAPAITGKYTRAKMALLEGADLVIELPTLWATASAEYFASGSISLLQHTHCVQTLCYGCETPQEPFFQKLAHILHTEPDSYRTALSIRLKSGMPFPKARMDALFCCLPKDEQTPAHDILCQPNNILALEYEKALISFHADIHSLPIQRLGQGYHAKLFSSETELASATAIRTQLQKEGSPGNVKPYLPDSSYKILSKHPFYLSEDDFSQMLHYALLSEQKEGYAQFADCPYYLSDKIQKHISSYAYFSTFIQLLKSKDLTRARIQRCLFHILLNIRQTDLEYWKTHGYLPYLRILGFRKTAAPLLAELKKNSSLPVIIRASDSKKLLHSPQEISFWNQQQFADQIYEAALTSISGKASCSEYQQPVLIV